MTTPSQDKPLNLKDYPALRKGLLLIAMDKELAPRPELEEQLLDAIQFKMERLHRSVLQVANDDMAALKKGQLYTLVNGDYDECETMPVSQETIEVVKELHKWTALPVNSKVVEHWRGKVFAPWTSSANRDLHLCHVIVEDFNPRCGAVRVWLVEGEEISRVVPREQVVRVY